MDKSIRVISSLFARTLTFISKQLLRNVDDSFKKIIVVGSDIIIRRN